jgi:hypothetical protein
MDIRGARKTLALFAICFVSGATLATLTETYQIGMSSKAKIEACEADLSRSEFCELIARPIEDK